MTTPDADAELLQLFQDETTERLDDMDAALLAAETGNVPPDTVDALFRNAHTIKGAAGIMGFSDIAALAHAAEDILALARSQRSLHPDLARPRRRAPAALRARVDGAAEPFDLLIAELKASRAALEAGPGATAEAADGGPEPAGTGTGKAAGAGAPSGAVPGAGTPSGGTPSGETPGAGTPGGATAGTGAGNAAEAAGPVPLATAGSWAARAGTGRPASLPQPRPAFGPDNGEPAVPAAAPPPAASEQPAPAPEPAAGAAASAAAIPVAAAQPVATAQPAAGPAAAAGPPPAAPPGRPQDAGRRSVRVPAEKIDHLLDLVGEVMQDRRRLAHALGAADGLPTDAADELSAGARMLDELKDSAVGMRTLPDSMITGPLPRAIRDLARTIGREVEFTVVGADTELDRVILESLSEPLTHLLRNSVIHGIEPPEEREQAGKPACGHIELRAVPRGGLVEIVVSDDGRGVSPEVVDRARQEGSLAEVL